MKRYLFSTLLILASVLSAKAMDYEQAREEAYYLTDKMAYELNLNEQQYNDAFEINLDYLLSLESEADVDAEYMRYRIADLQYILYDWQYELLLAADYFLRPVIWRFTGWFFPIYNYYSRSYFFYDRPYVFWYYRGGHGRMHYHGGHYYSGRRPDWHGGMRGMDRGGVRNHSEAIHHGTRGGREIHGNGYHMTLPDRSRSGRSYSGSSRGGTRSSGVNSRSYSGGQRSSATRGNSFSRSSSRHDYGTGSGSSRQYNGSSSRQYNGSSRSSRSYSTPSTSRGSYSSGSRGMSSRQSQSSYSGSRSSSRSHISSGSSRGSFSGSSRGSFSGGSRGASSGGSRGMSGGSGRGGGGRGGR